MDELNFRDKFMELEERPYFEMLFGEDPEKAVQIAAHRNWLKEIRHE